MKKQSMFILGLLLTVLSLSSIEAFSRRTDYSVAFTSPSQCRELSVLHFSKGTTVRNVLSHQNPFNNNRFISLRTTQTIPSLTTTLPTVTFDESSSLVLLQSAITSIDSEGKSNSNWLSRALPPKKELRKLVPLALMFFCILFSYTILRDTKDVLMVTAPKSGAEVIPFVKTYCNLPIAIVRYMAFTRTVDFGKMFNFSFPLISSSYLCIYFPVRNSLFFDTSQMNLNMTGLYRTIC
jgi:TLC ATP/ADP transporter